MGAASTLDEVMGLAQLKHRTYFDEIDHPVAGRRAYPGLPLRFDDSRPRSGRAPLLGEHTAAILCDELGYSRDDVAALMNLRVV
jgi:crotonobetainyl-CoA:carnitine CoA-transferase CaiB-like acyl-CoA transferase